MFASKSFTGKLSRIVICILLVSLVANSAGASEFPTPGSPSGDLIWIPPSRVPPSESPSDVPAPESPRPPKSHGGGNAGVIGAAIGGAILLGGLAWYLLNREPSLKPPDHKLVDQLKAKGPEFAPVFLLYGFSIEGLVKGGWPMVMDYSLNSPGRVEVAISAQGAPKVYTFTLSNNQMGRRQMKWYLPKELGDELRPALITVTATDGSPAGSEIDIIGFGVGPRAVGSVAIDQVLFSPDGIHTSNGDTAVYRFFSHSDFENASAEFRRLGNGSSYVLVNSQAIDGGVDANRWVGDAEPRAWDGLDTRRQLSQGIHRLLIRTWHTEGDWVTALSDTTVDVSQ